MRYQSVPQQLPELPAPAGVCLQAAKEAAVKADEAKPESTEGVGNKEVLKG